MKKISLIMIMFLICGVLCGETILIKDKVFVRDSLFVDGTADIDTLTVNDAARLPETTFNGKIDLQYYSIENCYNLNIKPDDNAGTGIGFYNSDDVIKARILYTYDEAPVDVLRFENNYNVGLSIDSLGAVTLLNGTSINEFSTDGTLAGDSDDAVPTEKAVKTYADGVNTDDQAITTFSINGNSLEITLEDDGGGKQSANLSTITALSNSAGLAAALSDETGTGNAVFSASPTFTGTVNAEPMVLTYAPATPDGSYKCFETIFHPTMASADNGTNIASYNCIQTMGAGNFTGYNYGLYGGARHKGSGLVDDLYGLFFTGGITGTGNVTKFEGAHIELWGNGSGTIGTSTGLRIKNMAAYHSPTTTYGINIDASTTAVGTSKYGLYVGTQSGATSNWGIYATGDRHYLGGNTGINEAYPSEKLDVNGDAIRIRTAQTPASASAAGTQGMICWDANYLYICISTNCWRRIAHNTW